MARFVSAVDTSSSQADFLNYIYDGPRDERSSNLPVNAGQPASLVLEDIRPGTNYNICSHFTAVSG